VRLYFNRNTGAITRDPGSGASLSANDPVMATQGNNPPLQIAFHRDGVLELPTAPIIEFISKTLKDYLGNALILTNTFSAPSTTAGFYVGYPDLTALVLLKALVQSTDIGPDVANATARHALTGINDGRVVYQTDTKVLWIVKDHTNLTTDAGWSTDVPLKDSFQLGAEIVLRESPNFGKESSQAFTLQVNADYDNGNETAPTTGPTFGLGIVGNRPDITTLTGGTSNALDAIVTAGGLATPYITLLIRAAGSPRFWQLIPGLPIVSASAENPTILNIPGHGLADGATISVGGNGAVTAGDYVLTVVDADNLSIPFDNSAGAITAGGFATIGANPTVGRVRPVDFNAATNAIYWESVV